MKTIFELIAVAIFKVDTVLYKTFGFVSPFRRDSWTRRGRRLQQDLDREHSLRDYLNSYHDTSYTTKQALALKDNNVL